MKLLLFLVGLFLLTAAVRGQSETQPQVYVRHLEAVRYPPLAAQMSLQGTVKLKLTISADGKVIDVVSLSDDPTVKANAFLERESAAVIKKWTFGCSNCAAGATYEHVMTFAYKIEGMARYGGAINEPVMDLPDQITLTASPIICDHCPSAAPSVSFIEPGGSVGLLRLGESQDIVETVSPLRLTKEYEAAGPKCVPRTEMTWSGDDAGGYVTAYLRNGSVFQIESATPRFRTAEGITMNSTPSSVKAHYKQLLESYVLDPSGDQRFGYRDFIYWASRQEGIAFELAYSPKTRHRFVSKVIVFVPGTEFFPAGCVAPTQHFLQEAAYYLDAR